MALGARTWELRGSTKISSTLRTADTTVGTDYPQVGDWIIFGVGTDNSGATGPTIQSIAKISGTGVVGAWTILNAGTLPGNQTTALAAARPSVARAQVTTAFAGDEVFEATLTNTVAGGVGAAFCAALYGTAGETFTFGTSVVFAANGLIGPASYTAWGVAAFSTESNAEPTVSTGARVAGLTTTGGGAAGNAGGSILITTASGGGTTATVVDGGYVGWQVALSGGTTQVTATRATTWATTAAITATRATTWNVASTATQVTATRLTTWSVFAQVTSSRLTTWNVAAPVTEARLTTWNTLAGATATRVTTWDALARAPTSERATTWNVAASLTQVTASRATTWNVAAFLSSGPNYAGSAIGLAGGSGSWVSPVSATGTADATYATWTAP